MEGDSNSPSDYKKTVKNKLQYLNKILALASTGDFSKNLEIPKKEDEFTEIYVGIQLMIDVIREKISDLKKERNLIETENDKLQTLIDNLPVGVAIIDAPSGKTVLLNKRGIELLGKNLSAARDKTFFEYFKAYKEDGTLYPLENRPVAITLKKQNRVSKSDLVIKHSDGKEIAIKSQSVPVFDKAGKMISVIAVFDDITRQKELDKLKSQFVSVTSHQLRTPLGTMRWNLEMLLKGDYGSTSNKIKGVIEDIYESNTKLIKLVNDLLNVSRIEGGKDFDKPTTVSVNDIVRKQLDVIKPIAKNKGVKLKLHLMTKVKKITIDKTKLESIVLNLLSNAVKYNFAGGEVVVSTSMEFNKLIISVKDTGVGIAEKDQDKIFSKFYRTEDAIKLASEGTGLGLFVVKRYVELWGGKIILKSNIGKGSEFIVKIPLTPKLNLVKT